MDSIAGIFTISTNVKCYYSVVYNNFVFQQDSAPVHLAFNTVQLLQCKTLNFLSPQLWPCNNPELNSTDYEIQRVIYRLEVTPGHCYCCHSVSYLFQISVPSYLCVYFLPFPRYYHIYQNKRGSLDPEHALGGVIRRLGLAMVNLYIRNLKCQS